MKRLNIWIALLGMLATPAFLAASTVKGGGKIEIKEPVEKNLYVAGGEVAVNAPVGGDLVAIGGKIFVNAPIADEALVAGGELVFNAEVMGDLRVGGGKVLVNRNIQGDLVVAGGEITIGPDAVIAGDLLVIGGKVLVNGKILGAVQTGAGEFVLNGIVSGGLKAKGGKLFINGEVHGPSELAAEELALGSNARFFSDIRYWRKSGELNFGESLQDGAKASFDNALKFEKGFKREQWRRGWFLFSVYRFIAGILMVVLLVTLFHRFFRRYAGKLVEQAPANFGYGVMYLLGVPLLAVLTFITIIGIPVAFILTAGYGISLALAGALVATVLAYEVEKYLGRQWTRASAMVIAIGISLLLRFLGYIPLVGGIIMVLLVAVVFGFLYQNIRNERNLRRRQSAGDPDMV